MTRDIFRQIPELIENPVIVQFSDAIDESTGKPKYDSRITVLGELYAKIDGKNVPVLVSIELLPTNQNKTRILDLSVITSAYAKNSLQNYINENSILYIDPNKKRTNNWLSLNSLQLPLGENQYGSIRSITYTDGKVKIQNPIHMTQMQEKMFKAGLIDEFGNSRFSKDDAIYDGAEIEDLFDDYEDSGNDEPVDVKKLLRRMSPDEAIFRLSDRIGRRAAYDRSTPYKLFPLSTSSAHSAGPTAPFCSKPRTREKTMVWNFRMQKLEPKWLSDWKKMSNFAAGN